MEKYTILICDDEEGVRESLNLILSDKYNLKFAKDGEEALETLRSSHDINLLLLDIKMPGRNGIDVLKDIKSKQANLPVIIITGYQSVEAASEAAKAGATNYIVKPFESSTVLGTVRESLS